MISRTERLLARISHPRVDSATVLVIVDKFISGKSFRNLIEEWDCQIIGVCTSNSEAIVRIRRDKPELVLTDIKLDDCEGIDLVESVNLKNDSSSFYIYFTTYATDYAVEHAIKIASTLGYPINKSDIEKLHGNFESCLCGYYSVDQTERLTEQPNVQPIRVLLVDDQQIILWGLEKLIEGESPLMRVVGIASNVNDAKCLVREERPDILILNTCLQEADCIDSISDFSNNGNTRILIFTETDDQEMIDRAILNGARGVVNRKEPIQTILRAIEKIHEGELWLDRITTGRIFQQNSRARSQILLDEDGDKTTILTRKECMILKTFSEGTGGEQNKQMAAKLGMSEHTFRNHLTSIFSKLGIKNRFGLFAYAKKHFQQFDSLDAANDPPDR